MPWQIVISCEHGGNLLPSQYADLFADQADLLASHRGWDPGAQLLGEELARAVGAPFFGSTYSRLFIDLNRSMGHPRLHAPVIAALPASARREIASTYYFSHRDAIAAAISQTIAAGAGVIHIASHSFTPVLDGVIRQADVAWLYDPQRTGEKALSGAWRTALLERAPALRLRRNYPYQGKGDGLTTTLRQRYPPARYVGIELEINQRDVLAAGAGWESLRRDVIASFCAALKKTGILPVSI